MGANTPKRSRYIPEMLLDNFCAADGRIWVSHGNRIFRTTPKNVFVEGHLYTKSEFPTSQNGSAHESFFASIQKSYEYEERPSEIESDAAPAIEQIIEQARRGKTPQLSAKLEEAWKRFVIAMARRTPESQARVSASTTDGNVFYEASKSAADLDRFPLPGKEALYQDPRVVRLKNLVMSNVNAGLAAGDDPRIESETQRFVEETGLCVAVIRIPGRSFVIGSHGLTLIGRRLWDHLEAASWLPIANDVAVSITAFPNVERIIPLYREKGSNQKISVINRTTATRSRTIAGPSESLVRSLIQD